MKVSFYPRIDKSDSKEIAEITTLLENIKNGVYEDYIYPVRNSKNDQEKKASKSKAPNFTTSGTFTKRGIDNLIEHSGLIAIDFDHVQDLGDVFNLLINDQFTFALFRSISGDGLCCIVKIDGKRHLDAFLGLEKYYYEQYGLECDRACKDVSRPRFVSYDPDLYLNEHSAIFKLYLKVETKTQKKRFANFDPGTHYQSRFETVLNRINIDITSPYENWVKLGFAIYSEYGANGLDYFKQISQFHPNYDSYKCERKYIQLSKEGKTGIGIGTFYYICQQNGIDITDPIEEKSKQLAKKYKSIGKSFKELIDENPDVIESVVKNEFDKTEKQDNSKHFDIDLFQNWLSENYVIKRNVITRFYELNGNQLEQSDINTIYINGKKLFPKLNKDILESVIFSDFTETYNPIKSYLDNLKWDGHDHISDLALCINSNTGDIQYREFALRQWLIGIIESVLTEKPNILCLILAGKQNTGKSTFFTRLLPTELNRYFATSQLDRGKDDEILMCQSLIIFDDEFSGKSKQDAKHMKRMLSAPSFTLREPYGRQNVTLKRIATLCGTCNELDVLNDPTGNRRFIVFEVIGQFNYNLYNKIPKDQIFAQLMDLYNQGVSSDLGYDFIQLLEKHSEEFVEVSIESELLQQHFKPIDTAFNTRKFMTTTQIKDYIESNSNQRLSIKKLGMSLNQLKFDRVKQNGMYGYLVAIG